MDRIWKITPELDKALRKAIEKTKKDNHLSMNPVKDHKIVRKCIMNYMAEVLNDRPPIKIQRERRYIIFKAIKYEKKI